MTTNEVHDLAALYVVDALTPDEVAEFETHLADCLACQEEVADMRSATEKLSRSVQADPPASLRSAVLASIASTTQEAGIPPTVLPAEPAMAAQPAAGDVVPIRPLKPRRPSRLPHLLAAAAVIMRLRGLRRVGAAEPPRRPTGHRTAVSTRGPVRRERRSHGLRRGAGRRVGNRGVVRQSGQGALRHGRNAGPAQRQGLRAVDDRGHDRTGRHLRARQLHVTRWSRFPRPPCPRTRSP